MRYPRKSFTIAFHTEPGPIPGELLRIYWSLTIETVIQSYGRAGILVNRSVEDRNFSFKGQEGFWFCPEEEEGQHLLDLLGT